MEFRQDAELPRQFHQLIDAAALLVVPEPSSGVLRLLAVVGISATCLGYRKNKPATVPTMNSQLASMHIVLRISVNVFSLLAFATAARADIFQWEYINPSDPSQGKQQSTTLAPDGAGVDAVPGADLAGRNLTMAYLIGADLTNAIGSSANLTNADLSHANLTNASVLWATLSDADFTDADVRGANFSRATSPLAPPGLFLGTGITLAQLYSTASYQGHDLTGIDLSGHNLTNADFNQANLTGANFAAANLTGANFRGANLANARFFSWSFCCCGSCFPQDHATLSGADLTAADARGAGEPNVPASAITTNLIWLNGHIDGLDLDAGGLLVLRDYDGSPEYGAAYPPIPITVDQHLTMGPGGTLRMVFEADNWDSTISFAPGIPVTLGGKLELSFAADVNLTSQIGRTFDLFNWTGVSPTGFVAIASAYAWDLSNLYTTGDVTLIAVPEPGSGFLLGLGFTSVRAVRRVAQHRRNRVPRFAGPYLHSGHRRCRAGRDCKTMEPYNRRPDKWYHYAAIQDDEN